MQINTLIRSLFLFLITGCIIARQSANSPFLLPTSKPVNVTRLHTLDNHASGSWQLYSPDGFTCNQGIKPITVGSSINLTIKKGTILLDGNKVHAPLLLAPKNDTWYCNGVVCYGALHIIRDKRTISLLLIGQPQLMQLTPSHCQSEGNARTYHIRVLLDETPKNSGCSWQLACASGCLIYNPESPDTQAIRVAHVTITSNNGRFIINGSPMPGKKIIIAPVTGTMEYNGAHYQGFFIVARDEDNEYLVNSLDIEEYVTSVLRTESWPGWPLEVNKAFAIASRTYVIGVIMNNRKSLLPYHVKNTNKHQTYTGVHQDPLLAQAVHETRGVFIAYQNRPIIAMFDCCCGGVIPAHIQGVNFVHAPYLKRTYPCNHCKGSRFYEWQARYAARDLEEIFGSILPGISGLKEMSVSKKDKAGLPVMVTLKDRKGKHTVSSKKVYSLLKKVRSFSYSITHTAHDIIFKGKGVGHHLGVCQWGARAMIDKGYDYKQVLHFYFPGTTFMRIY